jgi:hypothetical protein
VDETPNHFDALHQRWLEATQPGGGDITRFQCLWMANWYSSIDG